MVFEHIWRDPDFNINNGKQWNPFSDNITAQDMNYIVSNLNYVADNIGAFTENAEEAVRIASDASNLSIQASEKVNIAVNASNEALQKANTADINSAEAVAKTVHLSPNYFSEYFKKQTGEKFSLVVLRLRIDFAANLLKISDLSVKEIAFESGFNSAAYFSNTFKAFYHMSPDKYRKLHRIDPTETA